MLDVARRLADQGLGHYAEVFRENGIAGDILRELTDADLKELGLNLGDRKRDPHDSGPLVEMGHLRSPIGVGDRVDTEIKVADAAYV